MFWKKSNKKVIQVREGKVEVFRGKNRQWYFRLKSANGKIVAQSEGYKRKGSAINGIDASWQILHDNINNITIIK